MPLVSVIGDVVEHDEGDPSVVSPGPRTGFELSRFTPLTREGDFCATHGSGNGDVIPGSFTVKANGARIARIGDRTSCNGTITGPGANFVFNTL